MKVVTLDEPLHLVDNMVDLVFAKLWNISLRWESIERCDDNLALAHQFDEFYIMIPISFPSGVGDDMV